MTDPVQPSDLASDGPEAIERLLDANLDRAREGLRVLEDWCRFVLRRPDLVVRLKDLRQRLGQCHRFRYKLARHAAGDSSAGLAHPAQAAREDPLAVVAANAGRVQEALRVLEEFGRAVDPPLALEAARMRYILYDLEVDCLRGGAADGLSRRDRLARCHLYLITSPRPDLERVVEAALAGGVRLVQYRPKDQPSTDLARLTEARALRRLCQRHGALFLLNDRLDLALAADADGVHLGQTDLPLAEARRLLGPERLIGRSTHSLEHLRQAVSEGCDYVGVGPVHATPSKPGRDSVGLAYVAAAAEHSPLPWFAIGGINATNLAAVQQAGARRVAVIRAITEAEDPRAATQSLLQQLGSAS
ncbi:MAG: thiamine phosphate synthase [Cyanobacteriota bacterium]|nr:thiamine phosphate synthase [Cyanobacteriota bacterium]